MTCHAEPVSGAGIFSPVYLGLWIFIEKGGRRVTASYSEEGLLIGAIDLRSSYCGRTISTSLMSRMDWLLMKFDPTIPMIYWRI